MRNGTGYIETFVTEKHLLALLFTVRWIKAEESFGLSISMHESALGTRRGLWNEPVKLDKNTDELHIASLGRTNVAVRSGLS